MNRTIASAKDETRADLLSAMAAVSGEVLDLRVRLAKAIAEQDRIRRQLQDLEEGEA